MATSPERNGPSKLLSTLGRVCFGVLVLVWHTELAYVSILARFRFASSNISRIHFIPIYPWQVRPVQASQKLPSQKPYELDVLLGSETSSQLYFPCVERSARDCYQQMTAMVG